MITRRINKTKPKITKLENNIHNLNSDSNASLFRIGGRKDVRRANQAEADRLLEQPAARLSHRGGWDHLYVSAKVCDDNGPLGRQRWKVLLG